MYGLVLYLPLSNEMVARAGFSVRNGVMHIEQTAQGAYVISKNVRRYLSSGTGSLFREKLMEKLILLAKNMDLSKIYALSLENNKKLKYEKESGTMTQQKAERLSNGLYEKFGFTIDSFKNYQLSLK